MIDVAGEKTSEEIQEFFTENSEKGVKNYFCTPYEPWQDGTAEAGITSVLLLAKSEICVRLGGKVLVLHREPWKESPKCHLQKSSQVDTTCAIVLVWCEE